MIEPRIYRAAFLPAILAVLLLRGPQTPGELKTRSDRMAHLGSLADVRRCYDGLDAQVRRLATALEAGPVVGQEANVVFSAPGI